MFLFSEHQEKKKKKRPYKQFLKIGKYQLHIDFQLLLKQYKKQKSKDLQSSGPQWAETEGCLCVWVCYSLHHTLVS